MNIASVFFLVMFAALGALIAIFADRLGRKLGKKRLSLFGLRPRHTAELLTVAAGAVIPIATVLTVMALSAPVREWLINGPRLLQERDEKTKELAQRTIQLNDTNIKLDDTTKKNEDQAKKLKSESARLDKIEPQLKKIEPQLQQVTVELNTKKAELTQRTAQLDAAKTQVIVAKNQFNSANEKFNTIKSQLTVENNELIAANQKNQSAKKEQDQLQKDLGSLRKTYADLKTSFKDLQVSNDLLKQERDTDQADLKNDNAELQSVNQQISAAKFALTLAKQDLQNAQLAVQSANYFENKAWASSRTEPVLFAAKDELVRIFVPAHLSLRQARELFRKTIVSASKAAHDKGAVKNASGDEAVMVSLPIGLNDAIVTADQQRNAIIEEITDSSEPKVLVAQAWWNIFRDESVPLFLKAYDNPLIYRRNQPIAETYVQGSLSDQQIFQQLADFGKKVEAKATQDKMIPVSGRDDSFGEVAPGEVVSLVEKIHNWGKSARLIAMASQDTYAGDSLVLKFDLRQ